MVVDPDDDCTFWTTNNYVNPNRTWHTRVASFRFSGCGDVDFDFVLDSQDNCTATPIWTTTVSLTRRIAACSRP
jgi:hypothetical protein